MQATIGDLSGVFTLAVSEVYSSESLRTSWISIPDASGGDFADSTGDGSYEARQDEEGAIVQLTLTFALLLGIASPRRA